MESLRYKADESPASLPRSQEDLGRTSSHGELSDVERAPAPAQVGPSAPQLNAAVPARSWNIIAWSRLIFGSSLKVKERFLNGVSRVSRSVEDLCKYVLIAAVRCARAHPRALASVKKVVGLFPKIDARMRETIEEHETLRLSLKVRERFFNGVSWVFRSVGELWKCVLIAAVGCVRAHPWALASVKKVMGLFPKINARMRETIEEHDKVEMLTAETAQHSQTASLPAAISSSDEEPQGREHETPLFRHDLESTSEFCASEIDWTAHPESVHRIYEDLKKAVENHRP